MGVCDSMIKGGGEEGRFLKIEDAPMWLPDAL